MARVPRRSGFLLLAFLSACRPEPARTGITVLLEAAPDTLDDRMALSAVSQRVAQFITPGLLTFDDQSRPVPDLAESFAWEDPTHLRFTLRPGLTFHDGSALTARDVKATFEGVRTTAMKSPKADKYREVESIEAVDDRTVRFTLSRAYSPFLAELTLGIVPEERALMPAARLQDDQPIGAGPFRFASRRDEDHLELLPFAGYYRGAPGISSLHVRVVRDETTRSLELMKGRADLFIGASPTVLPAIEKAQGLSVLTAPGHRLRVHVVQRPERPGRGRRGCGARSATRSICSRSSSSSSTGSPARRPRCSRRRTGPTPRPPGCAHDPAQAKALLDEAGYRDPDGDGPQKRLQLVLKTSTDRFRKSIALVFQEQLAQVGIDLEVRSLEFGTFFSDIRKGNFEIATLKFPAVIEPDLLRYVFSSEQIPTPANSFGGLNRTGYSDPEVDKLLAEATRVPGDARAPLYREVQQKIDAALPFVSLWHEDAISVVSKRLEGYQPSAHGFLTPLARAREVTR